MNTFIAGLRDEGIEVATLLELADGPMRAILEENSTCPIAYYILPFLGLEKLFEKEEKKTRDS